MSAPPSSAAATVARLEARARASNSISELAFSLANDSLALIQFRQAIVFSGTGEQSQLKAVSGLNLPTEDSPYLVWLRRSWPWVQRQLGDEGGWLPSPLSAAKVSEDVHASKAMAEPSRRHAAMAAHPMAPSMPANLASSDSERLEKTKVPDAAILDGWAEWWPQGVYALPLKRRDGIILAWLVFLLEAPPATWQKQALQHLSVHWGYCWEMLGGKPRASVRERWLALGKKRRFVWLGLVLLLCMPVRQSALAPSEIIALDATTIASPLDGVVKAFYVRPNQSVKAGDLLLTLDDTTLRNRLEISTQSVAVANAEWMSASQKAFDNFQSKSDLTQLQGRAQEKRAELAAVQSQLARIEVRAPHDGIAVYGSEDDWLGRPVATGERILQIANPQSAGVLIHMPVSDALVLQEQAKVKVFLTVKPLFPLDASVVETSYQAMLSPEGVASYRLRAKLNDAQDHESARIGLHGTAKISGAWVPFIYYLLRRPLAVAREWSGW